MKHVSTLFLIVYLTFQSFLIQAQELFYKQFQGRIGERAIRVELVKAPSKDGLFNLRGNYYFERQKQTIFLNNGRLDAVGNVYFEEGVYQQDSFAESRATFTKTGFFQGVYYPNSGVMEGSWTNISGTQRLNFFLQEDYKNGSLPADIVFNDLNYESAEIRFHYPKFSGQNASIVVNDFINRNVLGDMQGKMSNFINAYETTKNLGGMVEIFESSLICYILYNENKILSLKAATKAYLGGAHEERKSEFYNFNSQTGKVLQLKDILINDYEARLAGLIEQRLRYNFGIRSDQSLQNFGFSIPAEGLQPTENFYIKREGLGFFYNVYEIAPYAVGEIDIFIPYSELTSIINNNGPLAAILN